MDKRVEIVRRAYNQLGSTFDQWAEAVRVEEREKYLTKIGESFADGSIILDVGCGNGLLNTKQLSNRFDVIGIDVSERQIGEARKHLPNTKFICADILEYEFEKKTLDGIVSFYCFGHIPRSRYKLLFSKFHRWLKPHGLLIASFGIGDSAGWTGEWLGATTFFSSHSRSKTLSLLNQSGFIIEEENLETAIEDNEEATFLWVIARKRKT